MNVNNILITGCTGFVGSYLSDYLSENSENKIFGLCRSLKKESTFNALGLKKKDNINLIFRIYKLCYKLLSTYSL